jgi:hypothetical protein
MDVLPRIWYGQVYSPWSRVSLIILCRLAVGSHLYVG